MKNAVVVVGNTGCIERIASKEEREAFERLERRSNIVGNVCWGGVWMYRYQGSGVWFGGAGF